MSQEDFDAFDFKVLQVERCSNRALMEIMYAIMNTHSQILNTHVFDRRSMLINGAWTSAEILVKIPRRMQVESNCHATNIEFFSKIRGVKVSEPVTPALNS